MDDAIYTPDCFNDNVSANKWYQKSLYLLHLNVCSLRNKTELELLFTVLSLEFNLLCFTKAKCSCMSDVYCFRGYEHFGLFRNERKGGGVSLYAKPGVKCCFVQAAMIL